MVTEHLICISCRSQPSKSRLHRKDLFRKRSMWTGDRWTKTTITQLKFKAEEQSTHQYPGFQWLYLRHILPSSNWSWKQSPHHARVPGSPMTELCAVFFPCSRKRRSLSDALYFDRCLRNLQSSQPKVLWVKREEQGDRFLTSYRGCYLIVECCSKTVDVPCVWVKYGFLRESMTAWLGSQSIDARRSQI